ncbi:MAG TPA: hypothetical protein VHB02_00325 [Acidimicrobiales bacterium]|nr:hypothetical protein [Acidimicrobiales bacterium]
MPAEPATPDLAAIHYLPGLVADALGATVGEVVGRPLALAFRVRSDHGGQLFLSGLTPTVAADAAESLGGRLVSLSLDGADGPSAPGAFGLCPEAWDEIGGKTVGTGPVGLSPTTWTGVGPPDLVVVVPGIRPSVDRATGVAKLRDRLRSTADRLAAEVGPEVDWTVLKSLEGPATAWLAMAVDHMARTRVAAGSYLIELADDIDDERIDQLGDGYVRAAELWRELPGGGPTVAAEVHEVERACVDWMRSAADPPTRYAF